MGRRWNAAEGPVFLLSPARKRHVGSRGACRLQGRGRRAVLRPGGRRARQRAGRERVVVPSRAKPRGPVSALLQALPERLPKADVSPRYGAGLASLQAPRDAGRLHS